jgi:uncharacterized protein YecT (DUF1311 family)
MKIAHLTLLLAITFLFLLSTSLPAFAENKPNASGLCIGNCMVIEAYEDKNDSKDRDIFFEFNEFELDAENKARLKFLAELLKNRPSFKVEIQGHTDERGTNLKNIELGEKRAFVVKKHLVLNGVNSTRLNIISYGEEKPICSEHNEKCWNQNNRVHFFFIFNEKKSQDKKDLDADKLKIYGPSFDCRMAKRKDEILICEKKELSSLDLALSSIYDDFINLLPTDELKELLKKSQRKWIKQRSQCKDWYQTNIDQNSSVNPVECIETIYRTRINKLQSWINILMTKGAKGEKGTTEDFKTLFSGNSFCANGDKIVNGQTSSYTPNESYAFSQKILKAIKSKDSKTLVAMIDGELKYGPRKKDILEKPFSEVFPDDWRKELLSWGPECHHFASKGFMLANGNIWYDKTDNGWFIKSINLPSKKHSGKIEGVGWIHDEKLLTSDCFEEVWISGDNYEEYYGLLDPDGKASFEEIPYQSDFIREIGKYLGKQVPLEPIIPSWGKDGEKLSLAKKLSNCSVSPENSKVELNDEGLIDQEMSCGSSYCNKYGYRVLKVIPLDKCKLLAPHLSDYCIDLRLVYLLGEGSANIYGVIEDPKTRNTMVVPLVNIGNENEALNFVDELVK